MLVYLVKSTFCLVLFLGFYHFILEKEKMHHFNRFYLLGAVFFSFIVPNFVITVAPNEFVEPSLNNSIITSLTSSEETTQTILQEINYTNYFIIFYCIISILLLFFLAKKVFKIIEQIRRNKKVSYYTATVVLLKEQVLPHTFLNYIFINKKEYQTASLEQQILTHELTHVRQKHTLDVLFIEILQNLFWFNPIFHFYRKAIQLNHEFLADDAVINSHKNIAEYQHLLLNKTAQNNNIYLASNFNYSLTKKRLLMMTTPSSKTKILLKKLLILPLTIGFVFAFAQRVEAQKKKKEKPQVVEVSTDNKGISKKEMKEYNALMAKSKRSKIYMRKDILQMQFLYKKMSVKQQNSVTDIYKLVPPPPPMSLKKNTPSVAVYNSFKNKEDFAIWIDGKVVDNTKLNDYKNSDFSFYSKSFIYKNARSKRFPQDYQVRLYTKLHFSKLKAKEKIANKNIVNLYLNKNGSISVKNKTTTVDKLTNVLNSFIKNKEDVLVTIKGTKTKSNTFLVDKIVKTLRKDGIYKINVNHKLLPPPPPMDLVFTYNRLAKKIGSSTNKKLANIQYLYKLYNKMNTPQKNKVKKPSSIVPPPPKPVKIEVIEKKSSRKKSKKDPKPVSIKVIEKVGSKELIEIIEKEKKTTKQPVITEVIEKENIPKLKAVKESSPMNEKATLIEVVEEPIKIKEVPLSKKELKALTLKESLRKSVKNEKKRMSKKQL